jgi:phage baseplate assembly protein W
MSGLSVKLPLVLDSDDGAYKLIKDFKSMVQQNFKTLMLTSPGERIMDIHFGVGLRQFLFEPNVDLVYDAISTKINEQVSKYMPFIQVDDIQFSHDTDDPRLDGTFIKIRVFYIILPLDIEDILEVAEKIN